MELTTFNGETSAAGASRAPLSLPAVAHLMQDISADIIHHDPEERSEGTGSTESDPEALTEGGPIRVSRRCAITNCQLYSLSAAGTALAAGLTVYGIQGLANYYKPNIDSKATHSAAASMSSEGIRATLDHYLQHNAQQTNKIELYCEVSVSHTCENFEGESVNPYRVIVSDAESIPADAVSLQDVTGKPEYHGIYFAHTPAEPRPDKLDQVEQSSHQGSSDSASDATTNPRAS